MAQRFLGKVKSFNEVKGWGFVESAESQAIYGKDILFQRSEAERLGYVQQGDPMAFKVEQGRNGPIAVELEPQAGASACGKGGCKGMMGKGGYGFGCGGYGGGCGSMGMGMGPSGMSTNGQETFRGVVKSYNDMKGWGFIECQATQDMYGKDIMVLRSELPMGTIQQGTRVSFSVTQGNKGPLACNIQPQMGGMPNMMAMAMKGGCKGGGMPMMMNSMMNAYQSFMPYGGGSAKGGMAMSAGGAASSDFYLGTIKSFDNDKGYGFIQGDALKQIFGKDVFVSRQNLAEQAVEIGSQVCFRVTAGQKGPMAADAKVLSPGSFMTDGMQGMVYTGSIKMFNQEKGWGFITSQDITDLFGKDLFLHKRELVGMSGFPNAGDQVSFSVKVNDQKGTPEASAVAAVGGSGGYAPAGGAASPCGAGPYGIGGKGF